MRNALILILLIFFSSCEKSPLCDCLKGTGSVVTEERSSVPFHYVELYNKADIHYHYSNEYRITVTAGKKLVEKVTTEISNGRLTIENKNKCNWVRNFSNKFVVDIYSPGIDTIEVYNSSGNIYCHDTLASSAFLFESWSSSGDYHLKLKCGSANIALQTGPASLYAGGKVSVAYLWNQGQGIYDALHLNADDIYTTNRGMNDQYINVNNVLYARIEFAGNIHYKGNPGSLRLENAGGGQFIHLQ